MDEADVPGPGPGRAYADLPSVLREMGCPAWAARLPGLLREAFSVHRHGDWPRWERFLRNLPSLPPERIDLRADAVTVEATPAAARQAVLRHTLQQLHPWRKGPYRLHGVTIDSEWRCEFKWRRFADEVKPLDGRRVLDVGCGNGYYAWRMLGAGAARVIGIDPTLLYVVQFLTVKHFAGAFPIHVLPIAIEDLPPKLRAFDTVFSMGVLYHRRSPLDHLLELKGCLRSGGELVLETLVIEGGEGLTLVPEGRYAQMRNVWFIPTPATLERWLRRCGFRDIRLIDISETTPDEQRSTAWMRFHSLREGLDPERPHLTVEGHPAPRRALFLAEAP